MVTTYVVDTSMWFLACGSKVLYVLLLLIVALRATISNNEDDSYRT
jgi:hypothetical protein